MDEILTQAERIARLGASDPDSAKEAFDAQRLVQELRVHQIELEAQNQALRETRDELEASRARYASLYDFAPIAYCTFDCRGVILEINQTGAAMLGRGAKDITGIPFHVVARIERVSDFFAHLERSAKSSSPVSTELAVRTAEQELRELQLVSSMVQANDGARTLRTAILDVSAQRRAEREASTEKTERAELDALERVATSVNTALAELASKDLPSFLRVIADEARAAMSAESLALHVSGELSEGQVSWVWSPKPRADADVLQLVAASERADHATLDVSYLSVPIRYQQRAQGRLHFIRKLGRQQFTRRDQRLAELLADRIGVAMETARLHCAESAQRAAAELLAERLASVTENVEDALALYDKDQRLVLCNHIFRTLVQPAQPGTVVGRQYSELVESSLARLASDGRDAYRAARLAPGATAERFDVQLQDGRSFRVRNRPTPEGGMVQTVLDLTDDFRRERELCEAREAAERASAAKTEFLSSVSHELRTPLNAILGFAQLLRMDRKQPLAHRHMERVQHIQHSGEHLLQLIDEVLELSRIESGRTDIAIEPVSVDDLLHDVQNTLAAMAADAEIHVSIPHLEAAPHVLADRRRCKQVLVNFGTNAIKYGKRGGKVQLRVEQAAERVRIVVCDDGMGIAPEKQASVFEPFQRAGRENGPIEGTGIGLAIAKRLTELMDGRIGFQSEEGRGSEFWIELPAADALRDAEPTSAAALAQPASERLSVHALARVLYIEDNPESADLMRHVLQDDDSVQLEIASTAEQGLELARERVPQVVILDVNLPGISGLEAAQRLRAWPETRNVPLVALSAAAMPDDIERIGRAGFDRHLTKPVEIDELLRVLEELLAPQP